MYRTQLTGVGGLRGEDMLEVKQSLGAARQTTRGGSSRRGEERWEAIVIGSGLGGLTTAAYLAGHGLRTLVLEQYDVAGGATHVFRRKRGFEFDVGLHYLGDCQPDGLIPTVLRGVGLDGRIDFLPMDADGFDTLVFPDLTFRVRAGWENYEQDLLAAFPAEHAGISKCVGVLRKIASQAMNGRQPQRLRELLAVPIRAPTLVRWSRHTLAELFDACRLSYRARAVIAGQAGSYGAPPSRASVLMHALICDHYLRSGGYYPKGGGQVLAAHLLDVLHAHEGAVRTRARVTRILLEDNAAVGVELADGEQLRAPIVVSNADLKRTYRELVGAEHLRRRTLARLRRMQMSPPLFCVYLALDIDLAQRMPNTNYYLFPSWDVEADYNACRRGRLVAKPAVYVTVATTKDPQTGVAAPAGLTNLQVMAVAPAARAFWGLEQEPTAGRYSRHEGYRAVKAEVTERLIEQTAQGLIPDLREHVVWQEAATPMTHERYTRSTGGTSYGLEHSPSQIGPRRGRFKTEIRGLFLVGANTMYGHGVAGVMLGGVGCASAVLGRDLYAEITAGRRFVDPARLPSHEPGWDPLEACRRLSSPTGAQDPSSARARASA